MHALKESILQCYDLPPDLQQIVSYRQLKRVLSMFLHRKSKKLAT